MVRTNVGHPSRCREPVGWTGSYVNPKGKQWTVCNCQEHLDGVDGVPWWASVWPISSSETSTSCGSCWSRGVRQSLFWACTRDTVVGMGCF